MLFQGKSVGHAGDVVGYRSVRADLPRLSSLLLNEVLVHFFGISDVSRKKIMNDLTSCLCLLTHLRMAIKVP